MSTRYVLWHNPRCSKSRGALALLAERGVHPQIRDYLREPPSSDELQALLRALDMPARALLRSGEAVFTELGLADQTLEEARLLDAMSAHPALIERPILVAGPRAVVGRPPERILDLLA